MKYLIIFWFVCATLCKGFGQSGGDQDSLSNIIMNADTIFHVSFDDSEVDTLINNVILTQDSLVMYCNRAVVLNQINAKAYEEVVIIHHDTIQIFADSMYYNGVLQLAELFGEVILQDGERRLFTDRLLYNVQDKTAEYVTGGTLIDGIDTIKSKEGYYFQKEKRVKLVGNVSFVDSTRVLKTDSILYLYDIDQLNIIAPTEIDQDDIDIYCESGLYRLENDRGVLSNNVQVKSGEQIITSEILDIKGANHTYTFLVNPLIQDKESTARGDTIIFYDEEGLIELRSNASYVSKSEDMSAPLIRYNKNTETYSTVGRAKVISGENIIQANEITSEEDEVTRLLGDVSILDIESDISIISDEGIKTAHETKLFSKVGQPLLTYNMSSSSLKLRADTLFSTEITTASPIDTTLIEDKVDSLSLTVDSLAIDTIDISGERNEEEIPEEGQSDQLVKKQFYATNKVKFRAGDTYGASEHFVFNQQDSILVLTKRPILWSDSTQMSGDTIKIFLKNNEVYKISLINNAFIISPDSLGMLNQIRGINIDNFIIDEELSSSFVQGNAELFYMVAEGDSYSGINLTKSDKMTFFFEEAAITEIQMLGQPESNMYEYQEGMSLDSYYLEGFEWRIGERPSEKLFLYDISKE